MCQKTKKTKAKLMGRLQRVVLHCWLGDRSLVKFLLFSSMVLDVVIDDLSREQERVIKFRPLSSWQIKPIWKINEYLTGRTHGSVHWNSRKEISINITKLEVRHGNRKYSCEL